MTQDDNKPAAMALDRFEEMVDAYGADSSAWPDDERSAAMALLERSEQAQRLVDEAAELDALLDEAPSIAPSPSLRRRVLESAPKRRRPWLERVDSWTAQLWPFTPRWQPVSVLAAAAVLGVFIGVSSPDSTAASEPVEIAELAFYPDVDEVSDDWSELP
jgi:hypothetical protein